MERLPLYHCLTEHQQKNRASFHTPGHKGSGFLEKLSIQLDLTELPDTDALYEAEGVILRAEQQAARLYGAERSLISAGGCTLAIQTMLRIALDRGRKLLCSRNVHRSAVNTMALLDMEPVWLFPEGDGSYTGRINPDTVEQGFRQHPEIRCCYITSPDYYGELSDIAAIAQVCHQHDALLLVDNAHGSHLAFMKENRHPLALGADMTACSLHKTMPVLTGGAVLNIARPELAQGAKAAMSLFGSTSPSYLIMASIDLCTDYMLNGSGREDYLRCQQRVARIKELAKQKGIGQPPGACDPLRITLHTASLGLAGQAQEEYFARRGIDCEFCDGENAVLICTPFNTEEDFLRLEEVIREMPELPPVRFPRPALRPGEQVVSIRQAVLAPQGSLPGIARDTVCPCPPGIPTLIPGNRIP